MKNRIAFLSEGNIYIPRGQFNAVANRTASLLKISEFNSDVILLSVYEPWYIRLLRCTKKIQMIDTADYNGLHYTIKWRCFSLIDYILNVKLHKKTYFEENYLRNLVDEMKDYDMIITHSLLGWVAYLAYQRFGIPYCVTWHGSDVNIAPFDNVSIMTKERLIMENASCNFFVSDALLRTSNKITEKGRKIVTYNGANSSFVKYSDEKRSEVRKLLNPMGKYILSFAGNFFAVKNIQGLANILVRVCEIEPNVECWVMGSGNLSPIIDEIVNNRPIRMLGDVRPEQMPDRFNATDVLVLPSLNEGMSLVLIEALQCGCNAVGSNVGGNVEVLGENNVFELGDGFVESISQRIVQMFHEKIEQKINPLFSWTASAKTEYEVIQKVLDTRN